MGFCDARFYPCREKKGGLSSIKFWMGGRVGGLEGRGGWMDAQGVLYRAL